MADLPWLVPASGPGSDATRAERTRRASLDLAAVSQRVEGYLVLHDAVDISFAFEPHHLPARTLDFRGGDALGLAVANPEAVLVTAGGNFIGMPISADPRWRQLSLHDRTLVVLGASGLSGAYLGCEVEGRVTGRFLDGIAEQVVGLAVSLAYEDGTTLAVEATTVGYRTTGDAGPLRSQDLATLVRSRRADPVRATSELLDTDALAALLTDAERLPAGRATLNGARWPPVRRRDAP